MKINRRSPGRQRSLTIAEQFQRVLEETPEPLSRQALTLVPKHGTDGLNSREGFLRALGQAEAQNAGRRSGPADVAHAAQLTQDVSLQIIFWCMHAVPRLLHSRK